MEELDGDGDLRGDLIKTDGSKKNFFNAIGVADMEKVHSAVIGWILSDKCEAFGIDKKSELLCQLFDQQPNR